MNLSQMFPKIEDLNFQFQLKKYSISNSLFSFYYKDQNLWRLCSYLQPGLEATILLWRGDTCDVKCGEEEVRPECEFLQTMCVSVDISFVDGRNGILRTTCVYKILSTFGGIADKNIARVAAGVRWESNESSEDLLKERHFMTASLVKKGMAAAIKTISSKCCLQSLCSDSQKCISAEEKYVESCGMYVPHDIAYKSYQLGKAVSELFYPRTTTQ